MHKQKGHSFTHSETLTERQGAYDLVRGDQTPINHCAKRDKWKNHTRHK